MWGVWWRWGERQPGWQWPVRCWLPGRPQSSCCIYPLLTQGRGAKVELTPRVLTFSGAKKGPKDQISASRSLARDLLHQALLTPTPSPPIHTSAPSFCAMPVLGSAPAVRFQNTLQCRSYMKLVWLFWELSLGATCNQSSTGSPMAEARGSK